MLIWLTFQCLHGMESTSVAALLLVLGQAHKQVAVYQQALLFAICLKKSHCTLLLEACNEQMGIFTPD